MRFHIKPFIGDTVFLQLTFTQAGSPFSLVGSKLFFTLKEDPFADDDTAIVALISGDGITVSGSTAEVYISGEKTVNVQPGIPIYADVQVRTPDGDIYTAATGKFTFKADVTKRTNS